MVALPREILDCILDYHKEREAVGKPRWRGIGTGRPLPPTHSKTLLACHQVSKQFRACALRHICASISIPMYDTPRRLRDLQAMIFDEVNPELGSLASFVKEVNIVTLDLQDIPLYSSTFRRDQLKVHKAALLQMLNLVAERIAIRKLSMTGSDRARIHWKFLHSSIRNALMSLLQLPSVSSLHLEYIHHLPAQFLAANTHLQCLSVASCWNIQNLASFEATLPDLQHVILQYMDEFPEGLKFPSLRTVHVRHGIRMGFDMNVSIIKRASKTLRKIIYNRVALPPFDIASFPALETFVYSPDYKVTRSQIKKGSCFFQASQPVPSLRTIQLSYRLNTTEDWSDPCPSLCSFNSTWEILDNALACGHFTGLRKLYVNIETSASLCSTCSQEQAGSRSPVEHARAHILNLFCESRARSLPIEVGVSISPWNA